MRLAVFLWWRQLAAILRDSYSNIWRVAGRLRPPLCKGSFCREMGMLREDPLLSFAFTFFCEKEKRYEGVVKHLGSALRKREKL